MAQPTWIGRSLSGRYQIETLLGQGGMSAVYKATDPNLKRVVAIKLIHSHLSSDAQFVQRFEEEAAAVASLRHPNIVQVYDFNSDQGVHYMVLEFVPGETLQSRLQRLNAQQRKLSLEEALKYTLNICDALSYAHQRGVIHRDIKPANIMLDVNGQAILMDFGIVKIMGGTSHTATGAVLGTASYISPELIRSEQADQRSDIYSLGITLYEMLSGETPFKADSAMTLMMMHLNDQVPDPRSLRADLPNALVTILLKSLEKDRAKRYQSVAELAADLKRELLAMQHGEVAATQLKPLAATIISPPVNNPVNRPVPQPSKPVVNQATVVEPQRGNTPPPGSVISNSAQYTSIPTSRQVAAPPKKPNTLLWVFGLGGGLFLLIALVVVAGLFMMARQFTATRLSPTATSAQALVVVSSPVPTDQPTDQPTSVPVLTETPLPATPTIEPTATYPPYYVRINSISRSGSQYLVQYETFGYTEKLPWMHIHFFFNTVSPDQAGMPGKGPWILYGGPRPFTGYSVSQRPAEATQMCALVANANHTVIPESGNCVDLP